MEVRGNISMNLAALHFWQVESRLHVHGRTRDVAGRVEGESGVVGVSRGPERASALHRDDRRGALSLKLCKRAWHRLALVPDPTKCS